MSNPQIVFSGVTLAFPSLLNGYEHRRRSMRDVGVSTGSVVSTGLKSQYDWVRVQFSNFEDEAFEAKLWAWWSWAVRGKQYSFALDAAEVKDTVLNGSAAAGQKDVPMANTSGVTVGKRYIVREASGEEEELIEVASITTNVKVTAVDNLVYGYASGDLFRARDYFPKLISLDDDRPWVQGITTFSLDHVAREDKG